MAGKRRPFIDPLGGRGIDVQPVANRRFVRVVGLPALDDVAALTAARATY